MSRCDVVQVKWGIDLSSEHERYLAERVFKSPVIVYNYPKDIKVSSLLHPSSSLSSWTHLQHLPPTIHCWYRPLHGEQWHLLACACSETSKLCQTGTVGHTGSAPLGCVHGQMQSTCDTLATCRRSTCG